MSHGMHERNLRAAPDAVDDLVLLRQEDITERGIVNDLRNRYNNDLIYTYIGPVLLSVNPFKNIKNFYSEALMHEYYGRYKFEVAPHVFASAEEAHRKLMGTGINQCVLISGESGAGKTEAAKKVMEYVSKVSADDIEDRKSKKITRTVAEIKDSLLKSNPVLEAFGNAKTLRNDNSSRFGKYMEILMDYNGVPLGGKISNYLLEKPRVVHQTKGERNFHIFYLLTNGLNSKENVYRQLNLNSASSFDYLCDNDSQKVNTIDDEEWFYEMDGAMSSVGIDQGTKMNLYQVVAAILWLGNIKFSTAKAKGQDACKVANKDVCQAAAKLLSVPPADLEKALTTRSRETSIDKLNSPLTKVDECEKVRDALSKALYSRLFDRLIECINKTIHTHIRELSLGVLDIYGFEIFEHNSFEQLCINYCNEKLQQYFIQLTLKAEQEEYIKEGIEWKNIDYFNNQIVCDLIESRKPAGVIAFLDEEITLGRTGQGQNDLAFLAKMNTQLGNHPHYVIPPSNKSTPDEFAIRHYAGDVTYSAQGMIDKNKDTLFRDLLVLCGEKTSNEFISSMFPEGREKHDYKKPVTAGTQFVSDMKDLIATLEKCEPHYIRCIKPNDNKRAGYFDEERVHHQVKYLGLLENVRVRRAGFAYRRQYDLFVRRYKMLNQEVWKTPANRIDPKSATQTILQTVGVKKDEYAFGKTKIFIEHPQSLFALEKEREKAMHWVVGIIQNAFRKWKLRLYFQKIRELAVNLLHRKKRRNNSWVLYYLGDYIDSSKNDAIMNNIREHGDGKVVFADIVDVYNLANNTKTKMPKLKTKETLVITPRSLYIFSKNYTHVQRVGLDQINSFAFSTFADNFFSVNFPPKYDSKNRPILQPSILIESVRKSEIATVLNEQCRTTFGAEAPLVFNDEMKLIILAKKPGLVGSMLKPKPLEHTIVFDEDSSLRGKTSQVIPAPSKKDPDYERLKNVTRILVSSQLGSKAEMQLSGDIPERVIAHTKQGRQGMKKQRRRRRNY